MDEAWVQTPEPELDRAFAHVRDYWPELTRPGSWLTFPLPNPYVRPGGFFKMFGYWDSYFILLGLVVQGRWDLAAGVVDNMVYAIEQLGHVPGYISTKTACRSRSQSPFLTSSPRRSGRSLPSLMTPAGWPEPQTRQSGSTWTTGLRRRTRSGTD